MGGCLKLFEFIIHRLTIAEVDYYLSLLVLIHLIDAGKGEEAVQCANQIVSKLEGQNRRTLDQISAKCYFYFMRAHEMVSVICLAGAEWPWFDNFQQCRLGSWPR